MPHNSPCQPSVDARYRHAVFAAMLPRSVTWRAAVTPPATDKPAPLAFSAMEHGGAFDDSVAYKAPRRPQPRTAPIIIQPNIISVTRFPSSHRPSRSLNTIYRRSIPNLDRVSKYHQWTSQRYQDALLFGSNRCLRRRCCRQSPRLAAQLWV